MSVKGMDKNRDKGEEALSEKEEMFVFAWVVSGNASAAIREVYGADTQNAAYLAHQMVQRPQVRLRADEMRKVARVAHNVTVGSMVEELEEARLNALMSTVPQAAAAVSATLAKAKLLNLLTPDKVEHTGRGGEPISVSVNFVKPSRRTDGDDLC